MALVDIAIFVHLLEDLLNSFDMVAIGGTDEAVVRNVHQLPQIENALFAFNNVVNEFLGGDTGFLGLGFDLLTMFVGTGQEHDVIAAHALVASDGVGSDGAVGVTDVQFGRRIVNGGCDIERFLTGITHIQIAS